MTNAWRVCSLTLIAQVNTGNVVMWENTAQHCRLGLFQDSDFAGDLEDSKSTSGGVLCIFGSHTFVPRIWMCKKQTSVSHSSTKAPIISLDASLRMDGIPALTLWDMVTEPNNTDGPKRELRGNLSAKHNKHAETGSNHENQSRSDQY